MNRFCGNLLLSLAGTLAAVGGVVLLRYGESGGAWVGGVLLVASGPLLTFAAVLGWWKADDAENLFGPPISRDDYFAGVAIPYAEVPQTCQSRRHAAGIR